MSNLVTIIPAVGLESSQIAKFMGANMGPTWVLSAPDGPHVGPMNLAIGVPGLGIRRNGNDWVLLSDSWNVKLNLHDKLKPAGCETKLKLHSY